MHCLQPKATIGTITITKIQTKPALKCAHNNILSIMTPFCHPIVRAVSLVQCIRLNTKFNTLQLVSNIQQCWGGGGDLH